MNSARYLDRVEAYTDRAARLYPGETTFNKKQCARIAGRSESSVYHDPRLQFRTARVSIKEFVRMELL